MIIQKYQFSGKLVLLFLIILTSQAHLSFGNNGFNVYYKNKDISPDQDTLIRPFRKKRVYKDDTVYRLVEQMPRFPGCEDRETTQKEKEECSKKALLDYVYQELKYPAECKGSGTKGIVMVSFIVDTTGYIENIKVEKPLSLCLDQEAMRVVNSMNYMDQRWISGMHYGQKAIVYYTLPIRFKE
ncbi:MAG: TonB family protein [Saprospiraceae bacterium]|jgi:TonB family protein|nr:TonB family protein [Saprospiraceae bacterium]